MWYSGFASILPQKQTQNPESPRFVALKIEVGMLFFERIRRMLSNSAFDHSLMIRSSASLPNVGI
jgi:hypothetical protein